MCRLLTRMLPCMMALLLPFLTASCSEDPEPEKPKQEDPLVPDWEDTVIDGDASMSRCQMSFTASAGASESDGIMRGSSNASGGQYTFTVGDLVSVEVQGKGTKEYIVANTNGTMAYNGTPATNQFYWETPNINVRAWSYGSSTSYTTDPVGNTFTLNTNQSSNYQELLYMSNAAKSYYTNNGSVTLQLQHMLSRIVITITNSTGGAHDIGTITDVTIGNNNVPTTAVFYANSSDKWSSQGTNGTIQPKTETSNSVYSAVLIPYKFTTAVSKFINITTAERSFAYTLPANTEFEAGKQYNFTIHVTKTALYVTSATVSAWGDGTEASSSAITATI